MKSGFFFFFLSAIVELVGGDMEPGPIAQS